MRQGALVLLGPELKYLVELSVKLRSLSPNLTIQDSARPLATALNGALGDPIAAVICLTGVDNVADVRTVMTSHPMTKFLFLTDRSPPRASLAHAMHSCGGEVLARRESSVVIAATLVAMTTSPAASA